MANLTRPLSELHVLTEDELSEIDVAELNLACAVGLPGAENLDIDGLLAKLAHWTDEVFHQTRQNWYRFLANPADYENSPAYFRMLVLITVLQRDLGVRYNPARVNDKNFQNPYSINPDFSDSRDLFLHGILVGPGGTCTSMPVLYVAVCRRLKYPVALVEAKEHLYCRWDDVRGEWMPRERLNIEATGQGLSVFPDTHYETWPRPLTDEDRQWGWYGKSLTRREELIHFLNNRAHCLLCNQHRDEAIQCFEWCVKLAAPDDIRWARQLHAILHPPQGRYHIPDRRDDLPVSLANNSQMIQHLNSLRPAVKIARGTPPPSDLPPGQRFEYVDASEADLFINGEPIPGRVYRLAHGKSWPACLPRTAIVQYVEPHLADDFSAYEPQFGTPKVWNHLPGFGPVPVQPFGHLPKPDPTRHIQQNQFPQPRLPR